MKVNSRTPAGYGAPIATSFYQFASIVSFALLGLWWVVLNNRYEQWVHDPLRRAEAWALSNYFAVPGVMSLVSLLAVNSSTMWRVGFAAGGLFGMAQSAVFIANENRSPTQSAAVYAGVGISFVVYALTALIAIERGAAAEIGLTPLEVEGLLVATLLLTGVQLAWLVFARVGRST